ncbi:hypothetical protein C8Q80DRAFT_178471 [Daedaleopsis nitida]|nr:hypothetical protein C8Q80DRAFT_178471 [Daedaleopsis nitida]
MKRLPFYYSLADAKRAHSVAEGYSRCFIKKVSSLVVNGSAINESIEALFSPLGIRMCSLESLYLHDGRAIRAATPSLSQLTRAHLPRLDWLALRSVVLPWTSTLYHSLRPLLVVEEGSEFPISTSQLVHVLKVCPDLESLDIRGCLPASHDDPKPPTTILLGKLKSLMFDGSSDIATYGCDAICAPSFEHLEVFRSMHYNPSQQAYVDFDPFSEIVPRQHVFLPLLRQAKRLSIDDLSTSLYLYLSPFPDSDHHDSVLLRADINYLGAEPVFPPATWTTLVDIVSDGASHLTSLVLCTPAIHSFSDGMWYHCFARLPFLEQLDIISWKHTPADAYVSLLVALQSVPESPGAGETLCCPRLRVLELKHIVMNGDGSDALISLVERRAAQDVPLHALVFEGPRCVRSVDHALLAEKLDKLVDVSTKFKSQFSHGTDPK